MDGTRTSEPSGLTWTNSVDGSPPFQPGMVDRGEEASALKTLRVCMYTPESQQGHARYARDLLTALAAAGPARGVEVGLVTSNNLDLPYRTSAYPIHAILPPMLDRQAFRSTLSWGASRVAHYVGRERTFFRWLDSSPDLDLIHFQEYTPWLAPRHFPLLRRRGLALVSTVHNIANFGHASQSYMRVSRLCWRRAWRSCSALLVHTPGLRQSLSEFLGAGHPPIHVTPHAVWQERNEPPIPIRPRADEPIRLLFFGMVRRNKGLHVLLRAMERLPGCILTVAGAADEGNYLDHVLNLAGKLPAGRVEIISRFVEESEIAEFFDRSHLVVLPYTSFSSQSGVLHQAMAHGRPVVASDVGGLGESVRGWGVGEVVAPNDERALAEGIIRALRPDRHEEASAATSRVREEQTWVKMAEATLDVYRAVVG
ncbi:MAG: hypothetical protein NVSMB9_03340 [Isosphaeraceae bacterium]